MQDADLALARTLQEQERAFMLFAAHQQQQQHRCDSSPPTTLLLFVPHMVRCMRLCRPSSEIWRRRLGILSLICSVFVYMTMKHSWCTRSAACSHISATCRASSSAEEPATRGPAGRAASSSAQQPSAASEVVVLSDDEAEPEEHEDEGEDSGEEPYEEGDSVSESEAPGGVALTDEELALMLQTEEHHAHMLELAGFGAFVSCDVPAWTP